MSCRRPSAAASRANTSSDGGPEERNACLPDFLHASAARWWGGASHGRRRRRALRIGWLVVRPVRRQAMRAAGRPVIVNSSEESDGVWNELATHIPHLLLSINQWWRWYRMREMFRPAAVTCCCLRRTYACWIAPFFTNDLAFVVWAYLYNLSIFYNLDNLVESVWMH